jgi:cyanophycin synthetase
VKGRRIVVLAAPGDRRDDDIADIARAAAGKFDHYIVRRDDGLRGRGEDEIPRLLEQTLIAAGVDAAQIARIPDEQEAIDTALRMGQAGDLLLIFADALTRSWKQIIKFRPEGVAAPVRTPVADAPALPEAQAQAREAELRAMMEGAVRDDRGIVFAREIDD